MCPDDILIRTSSKGSISKWLGLVARINSSEKAGRQGIPPAYDSLTLLGLQRHIRLTGPAADKAINLFGDPEFSILRKLEKLPHRSRWEELQSLPYK